MQSVTFNENHRLQVIIRNPGFGKTTLTQWLRKNNDDEGGRCLTYIDYLTKHRWEATGKAWITRAYQKPTAIGRLAYLHPSSGDLFYLRMLLHHQRGCKSFADIYTVSNVVHSTYRVACKALGLIGNDNGWLVAFIEAPTWATSAELRTLFTHMLLFCEVNQPLMLWETQWKSMTGDIRSRLNSEITNPNCHVNDTDLQQFVLVEIQQLLNSSSPFRSLADFGLPIPSANVLASLRNRLLMEQMSYNKEQLVAQHSELHSSLNSKQLEVYNAVISSYENSTQVLLFAYGHGGTGKTFLWNTIISFFRSRGKIVLAVAASGIVSLLLPSGRTTHSRFKLPSELAEQSTCYIKKNT